MNNELNSNAMMAWSAFVAKDYATLEQYGCNIYNYFVHNPKEILKLEKPLLIGKVFQACLGFKEPDEDIQEVRAENAFICFSRALKSKKIKIHDEAAARLMMLLIRDRHYLNDIVERACQNENASPYKFMSFFDNGLPCDMPIATNTKMLFSAYFLYDDINDKANVSNVFETVYEKETYEQIENHVLDNCSLITNTPSFRKIELGEIVYDRIYDKILKDIEIYSNNL